MEYIARLVFLVLVTFSISDLHAKKKKVPPVMVEAVRPSGADCSSDQYQVDEINAVYEVILPVSVQDAKALIVDSSAPLGFRFPKKIKDKLKVISRSTDRSIRLDKGLEGLLVLEFVALSEGRDPSTKVIVETVSLEMIRKKRDHSVAGAIVDHAVCLYFLFSDLKSGESHEQLDTAVELPSGMEIPLHLKHFVNSRMVKVGDSMEFVVKEDVITNGQLAVSKGASAWGRVTEAKEAKLFGVKGKLSIVITSVEAANGKPVSVQARSDDLQESVTDKSRFPKGYVAPVLYLLAAGGQPKLMAGSEHTVYVK